MTDNVRPFPAKPAEKEERHETRQQFEHLEFLAGGAQAMAENAQAMMKQLEEILAGNERVHKMLLELGGAEKAEDKEK